MIITVPNWEKYNPRKELKSMNWLRLNNNLPEEPKLFGISPSGKWLYIFILCTCAKNNTGTLDYAEGWIAHQSGLTVSDIQREVRNLSNNGIITFTNRPDTNADLFDTDTDKNVPYVRTNERYVRDDTYDTDGQPDTECLRLTQFLYEKIMENNNPTKYRNNPPDLNKWYPDIEKLHRIDKIAYKQIEEVILWATKDHFWAGNILSGAKLREKFMTLEGQMKRPKSKFDRKQPTSDDFAEYDRLTKGDKA